MNFDRLFEYRKVATKIKVNNQTYNATARFKGDLPDHCQNFRQFSINTNFKKIFVIAGNHEYYNKKKKVRETNAYLKNYFKKFVNISFLNNYYDIYNVYCFIGITL